MTTQYINSLQASIYKLDALLLQAKREVVVKELTVAALEDLLEDKLEELIAANWRAEHQS